MSYNLDVVPANMRGFKPNSFVIFTPSSRDGVRHNFAVHIRSLIEVAGQHGCGSICWEKYINPACDHLDKNPDVPRSELCLAFETAVRGTLSSGIWLVPKHILIVLHYYDMDVEHYELQGLVDVRRNDYQLLPNLGIGQKGELQFTLFSFIDTPSMEAFLPKARSAYIRLDVTDSDDGYYMLKAPTIPYGSLY